MFKTALIICVTIAVVSAAPKPQGMGGLADILSGLPIPGIGANAGAGGSGGSGMGNWQQYLNAGAQTGQPTEAPAPARAKRAAQGPLDGLLGGLTAPLGASLGGLVDPNNGGILNGVMGK